jgi:hypothetical protein
MAGYWFAAEFSGDMAAVAGVSHGDKRERPDVGVAVVPEVHALKVEACLVVGAGEVDGDGAVAAEVEGAVVGAEAGFVVGGETVGLVVVDVTDRRDRPPSICLSENDEEVIFRVAG